MALAACDRGDGDGVAMRFERDGTWRDLSFRELGTIVREIAGGLIAAGVEHGDRVALLSQTRPEWTWADLGTLCAGATVVPIYPTSSDADCAYVLAHSGVRAVLCEGAADVERVRRLAPPGL